MTRAHINNMLQAEGIFETGSNIITMTFASPTRRKRRLFLGVFLAGIFLCAGYLFTAPSHAKASSFQADSSGTLMTSLVSYYKEEDSTDSYGSNNLTDQNSPSFATGKINNAVDLNGSSQYQNQPNNAFDYDYNTAFSVSFWMKADSPSTYQGLFAKGVGSPRAIWNLSWYGTGNLFEFYMGNATQEAYKDFSYSMDSNWHHVVITYSGSGSYTGMKLYVDDSEISGTGAGSLSATFSNSHDFLLGTKYTGSLYFDGKIDEMGIWSKVLSSQEIADLWNDGNGDAFASGPSIPPPLHQYMSNATTTINQGSSTPESIVVFGATVNSGGTSTVQLQVEVQPAGTQFTDTANASSSFVSSGSSTTATVQNLANGPYHWQARAIASSTGATSTWQTFGSSATSTDFIVAVPMSAYFNGSSSWKWPATNLGFNSTDPFTVEFWYRTDATGTMQILDTQMDRNGLAIWKDSSGINFSLNCANETSTIQLSGTDYGGDTINPLTGGLFDNWHHVAITKANTASSTVFNLYFDTNHKTSDKCYTSTSTDSIWIPGSPFTSPHALFNGYIDEVRIWDLAKSSSEIAAYYDKEVTSTDSHLRGLWRFNGTSTNIATNQGRNGTQGSPAFSTSTPFGHFLLTFSSVSSSSIYYNASTTYIDKMASSVATWNGSPQRTIVVTSTVATSTADLLIRDGYNSSTAGNVMGEYCKPGYTGCDFGSPAQDTIFLNTYNLSQSGYVPYQQNVITHELGHALRLAHSWYGNIMNYYSTPQTQLGPQDIKDYDFCWIQYNCQ